MKYALPLIAATALVFSCQKKTEVKKNATTVMADSTAAAPAYAGHQCFLKVNEGKEGNHSIRDSIFFDIDHKGDSIMGTLNSIPQEKDKKMSTYKGILKGTTGIVLALSSAEGMDYKEEMIFTLTDSTVAVKYGEMIQDKENIWHYKDTTATTEQVLKRIDCK